MNKSIVAAVAVSVSLVLWMGSGLANDPQAQDNQQKPAAKRDLMQVEVISSIASQTAQNVVLQGQVEAFRTLSLKAEVDGKVQALPIEQGQRVSQDTVLLQQDLKFRSAERLEAKALVEHHQTLVAGSSKLHKKGLIADTKLAQDKAQLASAEAQLARINYEINNAKIKAPFAGVLNERLVEIGDYVDQGQTVATLVDDEQLKITAMVPQHQLGAMAVGQTVTATMINGDTIEGQLSYISATADKATRSYRIEVRVDNAAHNRWVGMSATLSVPVALVNGHRVSTSVVGLNNDGKLQVKVIEQDDIVRAYPVTIIRTEPDSLWVSGLPHQITLITLGQDFVIDGQQVVSRVKTNQS